MLVLDIDMDFFLDSKPSKAESRLSEDYYKVWSKEDIIDFLENKLGLDKNNKINGRIFNYHNESYEFWKEKIISSELITPFTVVHIDSHMDLGLGFPSWVQILDNILATDYQNRQTYMENNKIIPNEGDYLLYAISLRWINKLIHVPNINDRDKNDYLLYIKEKCSDASSNIELVHNKLLSATTFNTIWNNPEELNKYYSNCKFEPKVAFDIVDFKDNLDLDNDYKFITFAISPNYTPSNADFIIDIMREYIDEV